MRKEIGQMGSLARIFSRTKGEKTLSTSGMEMRKKSIALLSLAFLLFFFLLLFYFKKKLLKYG